MENNTEREEFDLLSRQRQMRCELRDSKVKLTQVGSEGRVQLEIQEEALTYILNQLREKKELSSERQLMEKEICGLKAQLDKSNGHCSKTETEKLKSQIHVLCKKLSLTLDELEVQTSLSKTLKGELQKMRDDEILKLKEVRDLESQLETERLSWQQEKSSLLEEMEKSRALNVAQLDERKLKNDSLVAALESINSQRVEWQEEKASFIQATEDLRKTLQQEKEAVERSQASHQAQLEEHRVETSKITSALRTPEDLLETERLSWQQEKSSLLEEMENSRALNVAQLNEQKHMNDNLVAALKSMNSHRVEWRQEKTSLTQATEDLKKALQEKEQEWEEKENQKRNKKNKWF